MPPGPKFLPEFAGQNREGPKARFRNRFTHVFTPFFCFDQHFSDPGYWDALVVGVIGSTEKFENRPQGPTISSFLRVGMP